MCMGSHSLMSLTTTGDAPTTLLVDQFHNSSQCIQSFTPEASATYVAQAPRIPDPRAAGMEVSSGIGAIAEVKTAI